MKIAIIGGSGLYDFQGFTVDKTVSLTTPFGKPSDEITIGKFEKHTLVFLPRHGKNHQIPPHKVNYRANIQALKQLGVDAIITVNSVGGIAESLQPGDIIIPDQIIDYTHSRENTFYDDFSDGVRHVEFAYPYSGALRKAIINSIAEDSEHGIVTSGVYGCVQGPRLETAAEIKRMGQDGCTIVGMTAMPEAVLAREMEIPYAGICTVANMAAGLTDELITMEDILKVMEKGVASIQELIRNTLINLSSHSL